ncbi:MULTISPECIES: DUF3039 domain-containing protein [Saccharopolyspora]|uniref:DUF3039 domain-containing protein n=1 Tax=Saccharopolyspora elongata TaxID=2530387 RepID=A0A4R4YJC9_9PSEU|nr:DUF3039 domain-containing protein [Saccharopolyspora elongata]TDD44109.1 DUF3039 domain-containing protein [Saccharopolyspora elongata]
MNGQRSGAVILARLRPEYAPPDRPPEVHAYRVDHLVWVSPCGDRLAPDEAEIVEPFTGNPCPTCLMFAALTSEAPPVARAELESAPSSRELLAASPADVIVESSGVMLLYAPSWRERVVHWAKPNESTKPYGGGTVVSGLCGEIGWGPDERPPDGWPMCSECIEIAFEEIS